LNGEGLAFGVGPSRENTLALQMEMLTSDANGMILDAKGFQTEHVYSREFYDYRKSEVDVKFWFVDADKTQSEGQTPAPKKEIPASKKDQ
jgi:hypothetical protein